MGVVQHHDAVSGTEKQEIAFDYAQRLSDGINIVEVRVHFSTAMILFSYSTFFFVSVSKVF
jgi:hypothetical protein